MALDTVEGIREYRERVADQWANDPETIVGMPVGRMMTVLDTLLEEIDHLQGLLDGQKLAARLESVEVTPMHKKRKLREAPDLE